MIGGVDEAGRGSIIGPLVVAGVGIRESRVPELKELGVKDSKLLTPERRAYLNRHILKLADSISVYKVKCTEVDDSVFFRGLNRLEARAMARVIQNISADEIYVDCCDTNTLRYKDYIENHLLTFESSLSSGGTPVIHSLHHADSINVVVSAASIVAKVTRDREVQRIRRKYEDIGSGYPSDVRTMQFIRSWVSENRCAPRFARKSWAPLKVMLEDLAQTKLL